MASSTNHCYVVKDDRILNGEPIIRNTRTPVRAIVEIWRLGVSPEEIPGRLPHIKLSQVFDALSYYSDNKEEINQYIEQNRIDEREIDPLLKIDSQA